MPNKRRLHGVAALSVVTLATAGLGGAAHAADECTDEACVAAREFAEALRSGGAMASSGALVAYQEAFIKWAADPSAENTLALQEALVGLTGVGADAEVFAKLTPLLDKSSPLLDEDALQKWQAFYEEYAEAFPKVEIDAYPKVEIDAYPKVDDTLVKIEDVLVKIEGLEGRIPDDALMKLEDALVKIEALEGQIPEEAMHKIGDALPLIEEALLRMGESGEVDPAMLKVVLEMLPEDE